MSKDIDSPQRRKERKGIKLFFLNNFLRELCVSAVKILFMDVHEEMPLPVRDPG
jgi:hypothetical protein